MADPGTRQATPFPENTFPVAGTFWGANVPPVPHGPHHPQTPPSPQRRPVPAVAAEPLNALFPPANAAGHCRLVGNGEDVPPLVRNIAAPRQPQEMQYNNSDYHNDMANYLHPPPADFEAQHEYHDHDVNYYAWAAQGVPTQAQAIAPVAPENDIFHYAGQHAPAGLAQVFLDELPHQVPVFNEPSREALRLLASRYLSEPDSQVNMVRMEPGPDGGIRVVIALDLINFL